MSDWFHLINLGVVVVMIMRIRRRRAERRAADARHEAVRRAIAEIERR